MASVSSLSAPGVEVREYDNSLRPSISTGTTVFVPGFAAQGPVEEVISISSIADFENVYGIPTNAAERYFYYTVLAILNNSGNGTTILTSRLPYGEGEGDNVANAYTMLAYPAIPVVKNSANKKGYTHFSAVYNSESTTESDLKDIFTIKQVTPAEGSSDFVPNDVSCEIIPTSGHINDSINIHAISFEGTNLCIPTISGRYTDAEGNPIIIDNFKYFAPSICWSLKDGEQQESAATIMSSVNGNKVEITIVSQLSISEEVYGVFNATVIYNNETLANFISDSNKNYSSEVVFKKEITKSAAMILCKAYNEISKDTTFDSGESSDDITYIIGAPATYNVSLSDYYTIVSGEYFKWSNTSNDFSAQDSDTSLGGEMKKALGNAAFITINTSRAIINDSYEGYYFGITDNMFNTPSDDYVLNAINSVKFTSWSRTNEKTTGIIDNKNNSDDNKFINISKNRLDFTLDSNNTGSISNILQTSVSSFDISSEDYDDTINFGIFKLNKSTVGTEILKLSYALVEKYNASLGKTRVHSVSNAVAPRTYFVESIVESSKNMTIMVNPYIASRINVDINGILHGKVRFLSEKLVGNYKKYEQRYLAGRINSSTTYDIAYMMKIAKNNIEAWKTLVSRAGVSLEILENLVADTTTYAKFAPSNSLYPFATYSVPKKNNKFIGAVPSKVSRALDLVRNDEEYPDIDIIVEGGLGTIYAYANASEIISEGSSSILFNEDDNTSVGESSKSNIFNEDAILQGIEDLRTSRSSITDDAQAVVQDYLAVQNAFMSLADSFQNGGRGDCFYIADILRGILVRGRDTKVERIFGTAFVNDVYGDGSSVKHSWSTSIYSPIKHLVNNFSSSYASVYAQWLKITDGFTNEKFWVPVSGYITALMCAADQLQGPWYANAGLNRGIVKGVIDCAINPNQKQRGDLYKICVNSVPKFTNIGITNWGIRTLSKKASAFDQNTCRRTFLFIEKAIKKLLRYYLFEPNTDFTRLSIYNEIVPYLESIRNQGGIYSFSCVVDSSNNTPEIINAGNLAVDVSAAPTRTAEFIVLNMTANKYTSEVSTSEFNI